MQGLDETLVDFKCVECDVVFQKPKFYQLQTGVFFRWSCLYCDKHRREKEINALRRLPEVLNSLS